VDYAQTITVDLPYDQAVIVQALDATVIAAVPGLPELEPIAAEAGRRIQAALAHLTGSPS
jgi:hypothetical protein